MLKALSFTLMMTQLGLASPESKSENLNLYHLSATNIEGQQIAMKDYAGKVLLIVNVASKCGFTSQYKDLESLYQNYKSQGFVVLGFPSNDFLNQEPGSNQEIKKFCELNYGVTFPLFAKNSVTGDKIQPVFKFLTSSEESDLKGRVSWNFEKFLISRDGKLVARFSSRTNPLDKKLKTAVEKQLK
jgi:glutathione peroxidase